MRASTIPSPWIRLEAKEKLERIAYDRQCSKSSLVLPCRRLYVEGTIDSLEGLRPGRGAENIAARRRTAGRGQVLVTVRAAVPLPHLPAHAEFGPP